MPPGPPASFNKQASNRVPKVLCYTHICSGHEHAQSPFLDVGIDTGRHFRISRVGQQRPRPEGARAELPAPLEPCHNPSVRDRLRHFLQKHGAFSENNQHTILRKMWDAIRSNRSTQEHKHIHITLQYRQKHARQIA